MNMSCERLFDYRSERVIPEEVDQALSLRPIRSLYHYRPISHQNSHRILLDSLLDERRHVEFQRVRLEIF